jgi:hypothetical protein
VLSRSTKTQDRVPVQNWVRMSESKTKRILTFDKEIDLEECRGRWSVKTTNNYPIPCILPHHPHTFFLIWSKYKTRIVFLSNLPRICCESSKQRVFGLAQHNGSGQTVAHLVKRLRIVAVASSTKNNLVYAPSTQPLFQHTHHRHCTSRIQRTKNYRVQLTLSKKKKRKEKNEITLTGLRIIRAGLNCLLFHVSPP